MKCLDAGDYSIFGYSRWVRVERKSFADFMSCLRFDAKRLRSQLKKLRAYRYPLLVIEGTISKKTYWSRLDTRGRTAIVARLLADYSIPILFCDGRSNAEWATLKYLLAVKKQIDENGA